MKKLIFSALILAAILSSCNNNNEIAASQTLSKFSSTSAGFEPIDSSLAVSMIQHFKDTLFRKENLSSPIEQINLLRSDVNELIADTSITDISFIMAAYPANDTAIYIENDTAKRGNKLTVLIQLKSRADTNNVSSRYYDGRYPTNVAAARPKPPICPEPPCN